MSLFKIILGSILFGFGIQELRMSFSQILQIISASLLLATVILLWYYARQTYHLKNATLEHNELILKPCITAFPDLTNIKLRNIGNGSALNIDIEEINVSGISIPELGFEKETMKLWFDIKENFCEPHETLGGIGFDGKSENKEFEQFIKDKTVRYFGFPFFRFGVKEYKLKVYYHNILHQPYVSDITVDCKGKRIKLVKSYKVGE